MIFTPSILSIVCSVSLHIYHVLLMGAVVQMVWIAAVFIAASV